MTTWKRRIGSNLPPLCAILTQRGTPIDIASYTATFSMTAEDGGATVVAGSGTGVVKQPTQTITLDSTNNWIYAPGHGWDIGDILVLATSGSLSGTGLASATRYKIVSKDVDWIKVSLSSGGAPITVSGAGTGTHSGYVVGSIQKALLVADVATAGRYKPKFSLASGSDLLVVPVDQIDLTLEVEP